MIVSLPVDVCVCKPFRSFYLSDMVLNILLRLPQGAIKSQQTLPARYCGLSHGSVEPCLSLD